MKITSVLLPIIVLLSLHICEAQKLSKQIKYPQSKKQNVIDMYHGVKVVDPYRWMEDSRSEETQKWIKAENSITESYLENIPYREKLKVRLSNIWSFEKRSIPFRAGDLFFQFRNKGLQDQSILFYSNKADGDYTVLLDPNTFSKDGSMSLKQTSVSSNGKYLAYGVSQFGSDWTEYYVKNIEDNFILSDHIQWSKFSSISWHKDGFYYQKFDEPQEGEDAYTSKNLFGKIYYHRIGRPQLEDQLIFSDPQNPYRTYNTFVTQDEKYLIIYGREGTSGNTIIIKDLKTPNALLSMIIDNFDNKHTVIGSVGEELIMLTNYDAPNYRLVRVNPKFAQPRNWIDIVPNSENVLQDARFSGGKIITKHLVDASNKVTIYQIDGSIDKEIPLTDISSVSLGRSHPTDENIYFSQNSFTSPEKIYRYNLSSDSLSLAFQPELKFETDKYTTKQVFYQSKDGTKIPMFICHKKDIALNGNNPTLLYGYGGFGVSLTPSFSLLHLMFMENNGVLAVPNLRGGGEYGEYWHKLGIRKLKQNTFDDFIYAAEYLVQQKYTSKDKLAIRGRSNGGLLIGACMTQRPELFKVALPSSGLLDMVRYHKFTIGWAWASDYGTSDDEGQFKTLYAYSPLHNIEEKEYPATLVTASDYDDRVIPGHSFKFAATLQEKASKVNPVLIRIETRAGHGAFTGLNKRIMEYSDVLSFTFHHLDAVPK